MPQLSPEAMEERREALLMAAFRCFGRAGYRATSMRDICAEAEVSIGGLYGHFRSKDEIIVAVAELFRTRRAAALEAPVQAADPLSAAFQALFEAPYQGDRAALLADVSVMGEAVHIPALSAVLRQTDREQLDALAQVIARTTAVPSAQRAALAQLLTALGYGLVVLSAYHEEFERAPVLALLERWLVGLPRAQHDLGGPHDRALKTSQ